MHETTLVGLGAEARLLNPVTTSSGAISVAHKVRGSRASNCPFGPGAGYYFSLVREQRRTICARIGFAPDQWGLDGNGEYLPFLSPGFAKPFGYWGFSLITGHEAWRRDGRMGQCFATSASVWWVHVSVLGKNAYLVPRPASSVGRSPALRHVRRSSQQPGLLIAAVNAAAVAFYWSQVPGPY